MNGPGQTLQSYFEASVQRWPDAVAIDVPPGRDRPSRQTLTYAELARHANAIAHRLGPHVRQESIVAILASRHSPLLYAGQLAVLSAGAAYTCIDSTYPDDLVRDTLSDAGAVAVLVDQAGALRSRLTGGVIPLLELGDRLEDPGANFARQLSPPWLTPQRLAYVIYTSGTTGRPKGVMIEHASIANLVAANLETFDLGPGDRIGQSSSVAYDSSVEETWLALASGATLVVIDDDAVRLGPDLIGWLRDERITVLAPPPTLLRATGCTDPERALPQLRLLYVGGEALPDDIARRWCLGRQLVNGYGPTEATVTALREQIVEGGTIGIGRPVRGVQAWIMNETGDVLPDGDPGELCIGGVGLARGYRNLPEPTARKFRTDPRHGRVFRTGDLAHRSADGRFFYHGRLDAQVKVRGYRIELEAVEARLAECAGVREAACCVQGEGARQALMAFVVPEHPVTPPHEADLRAALERVLPPYMVPAHIAMLEHLPTTRGGKLDRRRLGGIAPGESESRAPGVAPRTALEHTLAVSFQQVLNLSEPVSIHADFFRDLGGDSLAAAALISHLRDDHATAAIATRDLYDTLTVARLAERAIALEQGRGLAPAHEAPPAVSSAAVWGATLVQGLWLLLELMIAAPSAYLMVFRVLPWLARSLGLVPFLLVTPALWMLGRMAAMPAALLWTWAVKRTLIGRDRPQWAPAWGSLHVRQWIVHRAARLIPWEGLAGTEFLSLVLRALGARVGHGVHIHRGVDVSRGGWDLLDIGDDVTIARDASVRLVEFDRGGVHVGAISLGDRATLHARAGMGPNSTLGPDASLTPWSSLEEGGRVPAGERWSGIPAAPAGLTPPVPPVVGDSTRSNFGHGMVLLASRTCLWYAIALPTELMAIALFAALGFDADSAVTVALNGSWHPRPLALLIGVAAIAVPLTLLFEAFAVRALGATPHAVVSRSSGVYLRVWLKCLLAESAGTWLSGTLFWPLWLRGAGMRIGPRGEISTIIDTVPDLVTLGSECFLADGIYLAGPRIDRGTVTLAPVCLGARTFVGNHAVIAGGTTLPDEVLLGVCTVADQDLMRPSTAWFGHPPLELPRRETVSVDRGLTHDPSRMRYVNRVCWELLRCFLPAGPVVVGVAWIRGISRAEHAGTSWGLLLVAVPLWTLLAVTSLCGAVVVLKWGLLGRVRPGTHPLWSCWCSRWDFLYVVWALYGRSLLTPLEGTLWLSCYLRAMGMTIGRRVLLGYGSAQVVDPDMLVIEDGATVNALFQAHTFEDRVLKIDRIHVGRGATLADHTVPLYGADIGALTYVAPHSVVMKRERLVPGTRYEGAPTRPSDDPAAPGKRAGAIGS